MKTPIANLADFAALDPFFRIIEQGLDGLAGPGHFVDLLAEDIVIEYVVRTPGYPARVHGRTAIAELYRPYGTRMVLERCSDLAVYHDAVKGVAILEYASHGHAVATGNPYHNRFISVLTIRDGQVVHWRDYLDPVAVFDALGWPQRQPPARRCDGDHATETA
ncbi:MAG: nuclear transport factor 2 family protein [Streptosporangiaceae bacterium]